MKTIIQWVKRSPLLAYFSLVFGVEWLLVFALSSRVTPIIALLVGSWLPNCIGLLVTAIAGGRAGLHELFSKVIFWRISLKWYAIALLLPIIFALLTILLYLPTGNKLFNVNSPSQLLAILLGATFTGAIGEELGWRGTALPRLQARWNALFSSLFLGIVWGLYHIPSFILSGMPLEDAPILPFMISALGLSIIITWTFNQTHGSLLTVLLYHFSFNFIGNATGIFGNPILFNVFTGILFLFAMMVVVLDRTHFTRPITSSTEGSWIVISHDFHPQLR